MERRHIARRRHEDKRLPVEGCTHQAIGLLRHLIETCVKQRLVCRIGLGVLDDQP